MRQSASSGTLEQCIGFAFTALWTSVERETWFVNCERSRQNVRESCDPKTEGRESKFRTPQPSACLARLANDRNVRVRRAQWEIEHANARLLSGIVRWCSVSAAEWRYLLPSCARPV